jgi:hypothetical protein
VWESADTEQITASKLIEQDSNDTSYWWRLPGQIEQTIDLMTTEGVCGRKPTLKTHAQRGPSFTVVSLLRANGLPNSQFETKLLRKGTHPLKIQRLGQPNFQKATGYSDRASVSTTLDPNKSSIGPGLRAHRWIDKHIQEGILCRRSALIQKSLDEMP